MTLDPEELFDLDADRPDLTGAVLLFSVFVTFWLVRSAWLKLTGRPAAPFGVRFGPREAFRRARQPDATPSGDVIDVEARRLS